MNTSEAKITFECIKANLRNGQWLSAIEEMSEDIMDWQYAFKFDHVRELLKMIGNVKFPIFIALNALKSTHRWREFMINERLDLLKLVLRNERNVGNARSALNMVIKLM